MAQIWYLFCAMFGVVLFCSIVGFFLGAFRKWYTAIIATVIICVLILIFGKNTILMIIPRGVIELLLGTIRLLAIPLSILLVWKMVTSWRWFLGSMAVSTIIFLTASVL